MEIICNIESQAVIEPVSQQEVLKVTDKTPLYPTGSGGGGAQHKRPHQPGPEVKEPEEGAQRHPL